MFLFHTYWDFFLLIAAHLLPSTVRYYRSCLRVDERCITVFSMLVLRIRYRINNFLSINLSKSWVITICYQKDCLPQSSTLNKTIYIFGERSFPVHVERLKYYLSDPLTRSARRSSSSHFLKSYWSGCFNKFFKGLSSSGIK